MTFKNCLQDKVVCHLSKISSLSEATVLADEFYLTHKTVSPFESQQEVICLDGVLKEENTHVFSNETHPKKKQVCPPQQW